MTDQELLLAIGQVVENAVETKLEPVRQDIRELKEDVRDLKDRMGRLENRMDRLEDRMDRLEVRMDGLEDRMDRLEEQVDDLKEQVDHLKEQVDHLKEQVDDQGEKLTAVRIYIDTDLDRTLKLLLEGQQAVWDRATPPERYDALDVRTSALEMAVRQHSQEIQDLKSA